MTTVVWTKKTLVGDTLLTSINGNEMMGMPESVAIVDSCDTKIFTPQKSFIFANGNVIAISGANDWKLVESLRDHIFSSSTTIPAFSSFAAAEATKLKMQCTLIVLTTQKCWKFDISPSAVSHVDTTKRAIAIGSGKKYAEKVLKLRIAGSLASVLYAARRGNDYISTNDELTYLRWKKDTTWKTASTTKVWLSQKWLSVLEAFKILR